MMDAVRALAAMWPILATNLGLPGGTRDTIKGNHPGDNMMCLYDTISEWLRWNYDFKKFGKPSWRKLAKAVRYLNGVIFADIVGKHSTCRCTSSRRTAANCPALGKYYNYEHVT